MENIKFTRVDARWPKVEIAGVEFTRYGDGTWVNVRTNKKVRRHGIFFPVLEAAYKRECAK